LRILMISDVYFPRINGVSTSIQTFARELQKRGHTITLLAPDYGNAPNESFEVIRIPSRPVYRDPEDRLMSYRRIKQLEPILKQRGVDLIHLHTPFVAHYAGLWLARRFGIKTVETYHTFFEEYLDKYIPWLPSFLLRFIARRFSRHQCNAVDSLVVPSGPMLDVLRKYGVATSIHVIPTGIRPEQFQHGDGARFRARLGIPARQPLLLYVGRVALEKNIRFLIEVVARVKAGIPNILFLITGEGPAERTLARHVQTLGLSDNVRFTGYLDRNSQLQDCYRAADLFLFASRTETQGLVLLESMAAGTPVVSTAVMGTKEVLSDGEGCRIAPEEVETFAVRVTALLQDSELRTHLSQSAIAYAELWSAPAMAHKMEALYLEMSPAPAVTAGTMALGTLE
jgi:1,2-diacylglycerol 3-alpha-glucosyltransferase